MSFINDSPLTSDQQTDQNEPSLSTVDPGYQQDQPVSTKQFAFANLQSGVTDAIKRQEDRMAVEQDQFQTLPADEINKKYAPLGPDGKQVSITSAPMNEGVAQIVGKQKAAEMDRNAVMDRYAQQHSWFTSTGVGVAASMLDPLNLVATFIPGIGEETVLAQLGRAGLSTSGLAARTAARAASGFTAGIAAQAPFTALTYGLNQNQASDMDLRSAMKEVLYGAAGAAAFHAGVFGGLREAGIFKPDAAMRFVPPDAKAPPEMKDIVNAPGPTKHAAMGAAIAQIADGRELDVTPFFPKADDVETPADLAQKQSQIYREGFAPGMTADQLEKAKSELFPEETGEPAKKAEPEAEQTTGLEQHKELINAEAQRLGVNMDDARLERAAATMAEDHNPDAPTAPVSTFDRVKGAVLNGETPEKVQGVPESLKAQDMPSVPRSSDVNGRPAEMTSPTVEPGAQSPSLKTSERTPPEGVFTTRATKPPSSSEGGVSNLEALDMSKAYHESNDLQELKTKAQQSKADLDSLLQAVSENAGHAEFVGSRLKDDESLGKKLADRQPNQVGDYLGGRIVVDTPEAMQRVMDQLSKHAKVIIKDDFTETPRKTGYRAVHMHIMGDNGISAEVQIQPRPINKAVDTEHAAYKKWGAEIKAGDLKEAEKTLSASRKVFDKAWEAWKETPPEEQMPEAQAAEAESAAKPEAPAEPEKEPPPQHPDDIAIQDMQQRLNRANMSQEEIQTLSEAHTNYVAANDLYQQKLQQYAACLASNGV